MFDIIELKDKDDYFRTIGERAPRGVYMCRMTAFGSGIKSFLTRYMQRCAVYIKDGIKNPDMQQLEYYNSVLGTDFRLDAGFIQNSLEKWLDTADKSIFPDLAGLIFSALNKLKDSGKTEGIIKNTYIKYMCWLYYVFSPVFGKMRANDANKDAAKIIFDGVPSKSDLEFLRLICRCGCDVLIAAFDCEPEYIKSDPNNRYTQYINIKNPMMTPKNFVLAEIGSEQNSEKDKNIKPIKSLEENIRKDSASVPSHTRGYSFYPFPKAAGTVCTNAWIKGGALESVLTAHNDRGADKNIYCNVFAYIKGIWDGYDGDICKLYSALKNSGREVIVAEDIIPYPDNDEIAAVGARDYTDEKELITSLCRKIIIPDCTELERLIKRSFYDIISEGAASITKRKSRAITVLCWIKRYIPRLFKANRISAHPVFIYWGSARNENEADFLRILSASSADVLIIDSDLESGSALNDKFLLKTEYPQTRLRAPFPYNPENIRAVTAAYEAERQLDTILYTNTGIYRNEQFGSAESVILHTTFDEIGILWNIEAKYRPEFSADGNKVTLPVIFAKISGVFDNAKGNYNEYYKLILKLSENAFVIKGFPYISNSENKVSSYAAGFYKNKHLLRDKIKASPCYKYGFIRNEMQEHILDKIEKLIQSELISGTHKSGAEYSIIATALNLDSELLRMIQTFDFTKNIPKLIIIDADEKMPCLEDSILLAFLNLIGFDIVIFSPGGYNSVEKYYNKDILINHTIGKYVFDINMSEMENIKRQSESFLGKLLGGSVFRKD